MTARWLDLTPGQYHAPVLPGEVPPLSHSLAVELINRTPLHARRKWQVRGVVKPKSEEQASKQKALNWGSVVHHCLLGEHDDRIVLVRADSFRTKAAQELRDNAHARGHTPVLEREMDRARAHAEKIRGKLLALGIDLSPNEDRLNEQAITWTEEIDGAPVTCRAMFDHVDCRFALVLDIKTTADARPERLRRQAVDFGYDVQAAAYTSALEHLDPRLAGRVKFVLAFCETSTTEIVLMPFHEGGLSFGRRRWGRAVRRWAQCCATGAWPGYPAQVPFEPTDYQIAAEMRAAGEDMDREFAASAEPRDAKGEPEPLEETDDEQSEEDIF